MMLLWLNTGARAQTDTTWRPVDSIITTAENFAADPFGNIYLAFATGQITKLNEKGDSTGIFNLARKYGIPGSIDVSYPLKLLFYYPPYTTLVVTDRFFNLLNTIDLRRVNLFQVKALAPAYDGQYWIYDEQEARLVKMNDQGVITLQTTGFRQLFDEVPVPVSITDDNGLVYLYDPEKGVYVFDYYGTLKTHIPLLNWEFVHARGKTVYGLQNGQLMAHRLDQPLTQNTPLPGTFGNIKKMMIAYNRLYLMQEGKIYIFHVH